MYGLLDYVPKTRLCRIYIARTEGNIRATFCNSVLQRKLPSSRKDRGDNTTPNDRDMYYTLTMRHSAYALETEHVTMQIQCIRYATTNRIRRGARCNKTGVARVGRPSRIHYGAPVRKHTTRKRQNSTLRSDARGVLLLQRDIPLVDEAR